MANGVRDACLLARTCVLHLKGHFEAPLWCRGRNWCLPIRSASRGSERLDLLQFDKNERCKHSGFALSGFHPVDNHAERQRPRATTWHEIALDEGNNKQTKRVGLCVSIFYSYGTLIYTFTHSFTAAHIVDTESFHLISLSLYLFNSLSMIQQVIPMDLIPSSQIYVVSFPLSNVVITPTSLSLAELFQQQPGAVVKRSECLSRSKPPLHTFKYFRDRWAE